MAVHRLDTGERRVLVQDAFEPRYMPTGHLVFARGDTLFAAPFDADRVELTGAAVAVIENVQTVSYSGDAIYRVSDDGTLAYVPAPSLQGRKLVWVDRRGNAEPLPIGPRGFGAPSLSPDGRRLAVHIDEGPRRDIWIYELGTDSLTRATFDGASAAPMWTPDGKRLVFSSTKDGRREIYWQPADGTGQPERLVARRPQRVGGKLVARSTHARLHAATADRPQRHRPSPARRASDDGPCRVQRCTRAVASDFSRWQVARVCGRGNGSTGCSGSLCDWTLGCGWEAASFHRRWRAGRCGAATAGSSFTSGAAVHGRHRLARSLEASGSRNNYQCRFARRSVVAATFSVPPATTYHWMVSVCSSSRRQKKSRLPARFTSYSIGSRS